MPSHPIATWITPCNSRKVQVLGTSTRRHTIGLIPSSQTLTCTISAASASAADEAVSTTGLARFGARVTRPAYRRSPLAVAGTPDILMLSEKWQLLRQFDRVLMQQLAATAMPPASLIIANVPLPPAVYQNLSGQAEAQGQTAADLMAAILTRAARQ